jgi:hypothetical protein
MSHAYSRKHKHKNRRGFPKSAPEKVGNSFLSLRPTLEFAGLRWLTRRMFDPSSSPSASVDHIRPNTISPGFILAQHSSSRSSGRVSEGLSSTER